MAAQSPHDWTPCQPGELERLGNRQRRRRQRRAFLRSVGVGAGGVASVGLVWWLSRPGTNEPVLGGIPCSRVLELADAYGKRLLPKSERAQIDNHLTLCPQCHEMYRTMKLIG